MFQKVMVQITKQKKEKSIINRIIVDVFQLNKKTQTKSTTHTLTDTQQQTNTERETRRNPRKKEKDMKIYCKETEQQCGKKTTTTTSYFL